MDNELIIHEGHNILITQERVVIGKNSYQLNDINFIECLIEKGIHRKIIGFQILWLIFIVWIPFFLQNVKHFGCRTFRFAKHRQKPASLDLDKA